MGRKVLICGANSAIAHETAKRLAAAGDRLFLVGRDARKLSAVVADLTVRGQAEVPHLAADLDDLSRHEEIIARATEALGGLDTLLVAHGILGDQPASERDFASAHQVFHTNLLSAASLAMIAARRFAEQRGGTIAVVSSVAGDRGRQSNYVYGAAKGGLSLFLGGLRNRWQSAGVRVLTIKPGLVETPMTAHLPRSPLAARPAAIARGIERALRGRKDVVYLPWFWRPIMLVIMAIPEVVFKRLRL